MNLYGNGEFDGIYMVNLKGFVSFVPKIVIVQVSFEKYNNPKCNTLSKS